VVQVVLDPSVRVNDTQMKKKLIQMAPQFTEKAFKHGNKIIPPIKWVKHEIWRLEQKKKNKEKKNLKKHV